MSASAKGKQQNSSVMDSVLNISHITFRDCRVHIFSDNLSRNSCMYFYLNLKQGQGLRHCAAHNNPKLMGVPPPGLLRYICHCV